MRAKQKIPANAHECDIYKPARNFLMDVSPVWILADAHSIISSIKSRFIKSTKNNALDMLPMHLHFVIFIILDIRVSISSIGKD